MRLADEPFRRLQRPPPGQQEAVMRIGRLALVLAVLGGTLIATMAHNFAQVGERGATLVVARNDTEARSSAQPQSAPAEARSYGDALAADYGWGPLRTTDW
jgi:hypothetical protein